MHFLTDRPCNDGKNHDIAEGQDGRAKASIRTSEITSTQVGLPVDYYYIIMEVLHYTKIIEF